MPMAGWPALRPSVDVSEEAGVLREQLSGLVMPEEGRPLKTEVHVVVGQSVAVTIARYALDGEFELIVMGTHGRGPVIHALMGSVAEKVVRTAPCPVLTIRHPSLRHAALPLKPPLHAPMSEIDRIAEHERATSDDAVDVPRLALSTGLFRNAASPKGPMEPHSAYTIVSALPDHLR
jgi:hypothetical protein